MTKQDKKDRRAARHEAERQIKQEVLSRMGLYSTGPQIRQAVKETVDRYYAETLRSA